MDYNETDLAKVASDFQQAWQTDQCPSLSEFLKCVPDDSRSNLLQQLLPLDAKYRQQAGEVVSLDDYRHLCESVGLDPGVCLSGVINPAHAPNDPQLEVTGDYSKAVAAGNEPGEFFIKTQPAHDPDEPETTRIGRYRTEHILGQGGFGLVYLAHDEQLDRRVAIKVPHAHLIGDPKNVAIYIAEARTVAKLDHPNIVPVYDVGSTTEIRCFIVSKFIEGSDLAALLKQKRLSYRQAAQWIADIADALHYAHKAGLVHRDVKPSNILIGKDNQPYVVDFGLALREENIGQGPQFAGTPAYMSPEQARGEGHRVDGRSDIFGLGAVFYEVLVGRRAFRGDTLPEVYEQIISYEPKPPRQYDESIPKELERICHKALAKRATDRYSTGFDMAQDLRLFLQEHAQLHVGKSPATPAVSPTGDDERRTSDSNKAQLRTSTTPTTSVFEDSQQLKIVPKGLRSFDAHDADFFLELLPGPRDRAGLPDSLRFWKTRIEETDPDNTFSVGLIYGPSGCGKSSLVKAGLLPRLSEDVISVHIEATLEETETRLLHGLRKRCPALEDNLSLKATLAALRRGQGIPVGKKVLIVLDQFEQWLHSKKEEENTDLVQALRQCDGGRVQCIVMVRDDFWMAVTRFLSGLEVDLIQGQNFAPVDLFPIRHAEKVLAAFGRAFGVLLENASELDKDQKSFITQSVADLAEEGKVICVRLALFAEMMKGKAWTPAALQKVGGTSGVGVTFLEETFSAQSANPKHRYHEKAARAVLKDLLPSTGTDIKGYMRSHAELLEASGYGNRPKDFDDLIRILDGEIRLITPTDSEGAEGSTIVPNRSESIDGSGTVGSGSDVVNEQLGQLSHASEQLGQLFYTPRFYQLTHDYLVHSLRDWLTRKQKETRKGRAELKLFDTSLTWNSKPENRLLPSLLEWINIRTLTDNRKWTEPQRKMMRTAAKVLGLTWGGAFAVLLVLGLTVQYWVSKRDWNNKREQTRIAAVSLQNSLGPSIPVNIRELKKLPEPLVQGELAERFATDNSRHKLALAFALAAYGRVETAYLVSRIDDIATADTANFVEALALDRERALTALKTEAEKCESESLWRRKSKLATAALALGDSEIAADMCQYENRPDPGQRTIFINEFPRWEWHLLDRRGNLQQLSQLVAESDHSGLRSGLSLAVGSIPVDQIRELNPTALDSWTQVASRWFAEHRDTSTHTAASWLLRQWRLPLPEVPDQDQVLPDRDWFVNSAKFTMLRIQPPPSEPEPGMPLPESEYWIASCEVTRGQFEAFMQDGAYKFEKPTDWEGVDTYVSPTRDHPAQQVSCYDAVMYCNWLSRREGKTAAYRKTGKKEKDDSNDNQHDPWELIDEATGYRLPLDVEWEYACRAGSRTEWSSGADERLLADYCQMYPFKLGALVGHKFTNAWGMQDMHGNVWEWCNDLYGGEGSDRVRRGGSWISVAADCRSSRRGRFSPALRPNYIGFRVALSSSGTPQSAEPLPDE